MINVKAAYCNDGNTIKIMDVFDDELYNDTTKFRGSNIVLSLYKEQYEQSYNDLLAYINSNYKYYFFGSKAVYVWNRDDLAVYFLVYNLEEDNTNNIALRIRPTDPTQEINSNDVKMFLYGDLKSGFDETKNRTDAYNFQDSIYPLGQYTSSDFNTYKTISGCTPPISKQFYSSGLNTNANVIVAGESYGRDIISNRTERFYQKVQIGDKIYNDGDYINRVNSNKNPKISLKSLTTTGDESGTRIGITVSVDFKIFDGSTRYSYLISFDGGKTWEDYRLSMTSSVFTFSKLENFDAIFQLYDSKLEQSYYTTLKVDNIDMSYRARWLSFERDDSNDEYTIFNGINYLVSTEFQVLEKFNEVNGYPFDLYYSRDGKNWQRLPHGNTKFVVHSNAPTYFLYREKTSGFRVFQSTYTASCFKETSLLGEIINFDEEQPTDDTYVVYATFVNYIQTHSYWIKEQGEEYQQINPNTSNGMHRWITTEKKTYCAKITEKNDGSKILQEKCHTVQGLRVVEDMNSYTDVIIDFIDNQRNNLDKIRDLIQRMYDGLPVLIKNFLVFSYFLFCMSAIIWNIRK